MPEYADLIVADKDDAAVTILELRELGDEFLGHMRHTLGFIRRAWLLSDDCLFWFFGVRQAIAGRADRHICLPQADKALDRLKPMPWYAATPYPRTRGGEHLTPSGFRSRRSFRSRA